jgi:hypothetical protein
MVIRARILTITAVLPLAAGAAVRVIDGTARPRRPLVGHMT